MRSGPVALSLAISLSLSLSLCLLVPLCVAVLIGGPRLKSGIVAAITTSSPATAAAVFGRLLLQHAYLGNVDHELEEGTSGGTRPKFGRNSSRSKGTGAV